jgi:hypothetical protein
MIPIHVRNLRPKTITVPFDFHSARNAAIPLLDSALAFPLFGRSENKNTRLERSGSSKHIMISEMSETSTIGY